MLAQLIENARRTSGSRTVADYETLQAAAGRRQPRGDVFRQALMQPGINIIAECKGRSPSRGLLRSDYHPATLAKQYEEAGAAAISVLTEPSMFGGSLEHLEQVAAAVAVPLLRKDFIVTEQQIMEARAAGADAVLLLMAALAPAELRLLQELARAQQLAALVEVHTRAELSSALDCGADLIGVNSRNLNTLEVSLSTCYELAPHLPDHVVAVAESGISSAADIVALQEHGYQACLIGERLVTAHDPGAALRELRGRA